MASHLPPGDEAIRNFIKSWPEKVVTYSLLAQRAESICSGFLDDLNIRHLSSSRGKPVKTIEKSIRRRQNDRIKKYGEDSYYKKEDEIYEDMIDLAGIRIKLYFPDDAKKIREIIWEIFNPWFPPGKNDHRNIQEWPNQTNASFNFEERRFPGYKATHFRCKLKEKDAPEDQGLRNKVVEVQVASVVMHAWQEVHHDIEYKPYSGTVSTDERRFLDMINGLAHISEIALEQLHETLKRKAIDENREFGSQWELGDWLSREVSNFAISDLQSPGFILKILQLFDFNTPATLSNLLEEKTSGASRTGNLSAFMLGTILDREKGTGANDDELLKHMVIRNAGALFISMDDELHGAVKQHFGVLSQNFERYAEGFGDSRMQVQVRNISARLPGFEIFLWLSDRGVIPSSNAVTWILNSQKFPDDDSLMYTQQGNIRLFFSNWEIFTSFYDYLGSNIASTDGTALRIIKWTALSIKDYQNKEWSHSLSKLTVE